LATSKKDLGIAIYPLPDVSVDYKQGPNTKQSWGWSVSKFSLQQLTECTHNYELLQSESEEIFFHLDRFMMGLGGYDSWSPNVQDDYLISSGKKFEASFIMAPMNSQNDFVN
jgi:hypothetical protein